MTLTDRIISRITHLVDRPEPTPVDYDDVLWVDLAHGGAVHIAHEVDPDMHGLGWPVPPMHDEERAALLAEVRPHAALAAALYRPSGTEFIAADITPAMDRHLDRARAHVERAALLDARRHGRPAEVFVDDVLPNVDDHEEDDAEA